MALDSIGNIGSAVSTQRSQTTAPTTGLRNNASVLNAIVQTQQRQGSAAAPVKVFAVPQTSKSGSANVKLPRGSLVDVVA